MTLVERIQRGEKAITQAKAEGRDVREWERCLAVLKRQAFETIDECTASVVEHVIEDGPIIAVEIASALLGANIWLAFDDNFDPADGQGVFYAHELEFLKTQTPEQLRKIHALKVGAAGLGTRVRQ